MAKEKRTSAEMFPVVESYLDGDLTQQDFSAEHKISVYVLNYWLTKYRRTSAETEAFLEIHPVSAAERPLLEVCYPTGVRLRIFTPLKPAYLDHLLTSV